MSDHFSLEEELEDSLAYRYARYRKEKERGKLLNKFVAGFDFPLDEYQLEACAKLEQGNGILVAAPTGAGKTVVGQFATYLALQTNKKAYYTTPVKALSNQKYRDFLALYGNDAVGLLTGDVSINPQAPIIVMTTEVLRNMLYREDDRVENLGYVILDEVHYLSDRFRGPVWEEVILHLPDEVKIVALSATVSNLEEFGKWLQQCRGNCEVVLSEDRPVPLYQHMVVGGKLYDLYTNNCTSVKHRRQKQKKGRELESRSRLNPALMAKTSGMGNSRYRRGGSDSSVPQVLKALAKNNYLPAIFFVFSRTGCEQYLDVALLNHLDFTSPYEKQEIEQLCMGLYDAYPSVDWEVVGWDHFYEAARCGFAVHHAGLLPILKELVELLFNRGLIKVVFATETLALGINMPAKAVVLNSLKKWDGQEFQLLTAGQYTQITGRAGRRGIDTQGHAVVVYRPGIEPALVASLSSKRTYPLFSAFHPTYNMSVNLLDQMDIEAARQVLMASFAQFQTNHEVSELSTRAQEKQRIADQLFNKISCDYGDIHEYTRLLDKLSNFPSFFNQYRCLSRPRISHSEASSESEDLSLTTQEKPAEITIAKLFKALRRGDVICYQTQDKPVWALVVDKYRKPNHNLYLKCLTQKGKVLELSQHLLADSSLALCGKMKISDFQYRKPRDRSKLGSIFREKIREKVFTLPEVFNLQETVENLKNKTVEQETEKTDSSLQSEKKQHKVSVSTAVMDSEATIPNDHNNTIKIPKNLDLETLSARQLVAILEQHPVRECPSLKRHLQKADRWLRFEHQAEKFSKRAFQKSQNLVHTFDQILQVLEELGYISQDGLLLEAGIVLSQIYSEYDLLIAQCAIEDTFAGLTPQTLAATVSAASFEAREENDYFPPRELSASVAKVKQVADKIRKIQFKYHAPSLPETSNQLVAAVYLWANGGGLNDTLKLADMAAGDFVRAIKQLCDVLRQLEKVGSVEVSDNAHRAIKLLRRGVVAWSEL